VAKIGRNDLCPCGSGKKYKKCCLDKVDFSTAEKREPRRMKHLSYEEVAQLSNEQIIQRLKKNGIEFDKATFLEELDEAFSAQEISENWFKKFHVTAKGREEDFPWFAAWILWDRLAPENKLSMENMSDLLDKGFDLLEQEEVIKGVDTWLELWEALKYYINPKYKNLDYLEKLNEGTFFIRNFVQDLEMKLYQASNINHSYYEKRIKYCREFCELFPEEDELMIVNMRRSIADSYAFTGDFATAEKEFKKLIEDFPHNVWAYIGYGDIFMDREQFERAKEIYEKGRQMVSDKSDILDIEERIRFSKESMK